VQEHKRHVLFVEDSADDRDLYSHFLSRRGYRVSTAENGREGVEKAFQLHPDVILMDLWMPEVGGWAATRSLKGDDRTKDIPVVIITGHPASFMDEETLGCEGFLSKPCLPERLKEEIERVLDHHHGNGTHSHSSEN
jgi:two-component system, cell cycle response regulator DivK